MELPYLEQKLPLSVARNKAILPFPVKSWVQTPSSFPTDGQITFMDVICIELLLTEVLCTTKEQSSLPLSPQGQKAMPRTASTAWFLLPLRFKALHLKSGPWPDNKTPH